MRPKVLFVINSLAGGGAERVLATILRESEERRGDFDLAVALLDREAGAYSLPDWLEVHQLDARGSLLRSFVLLKKLVATLNPDLTLSFLTRANVASVLVMRLRRRPAIISERVNTLSHLETGKHARFSIALVSLTYPLAAKILAVSDGVARTLIDDFRISPEKVESLPNPVDIASIEAKASDPTTIRVDGPYIAAMGRLVPNKNFALAIEAFAQSGISGSLVILGEGPERSSLKTLAEDLGIGDRVLLPGFCSNPYAVIARSRAMVLSSNAEGFPNALVEALACGVPVVATDCRSGPLEVLDTRDSPRSGSFLEGRGGLLVPINDSPAMANALRALQNEDLRARLVSRGKSRVRDFGLTTGVARYWDAVQRTLHSG